jgi:hypothetical protein
MFAKVSIALAVWFHLFVVGESVLHAEPPLSADEVIQKAVARTQQSGLTATPARFSYTKVTVTEQFDANGRMKEHKERVYRICFHDGRSSAKLVEVNGHEPPQAELKKQAENEANAQQLMGDSKSNRNSDDFLKPELVAHYDFSLVDQTNLNGRQTYVIAFQPKKPAPPAHCMLDRFLDRVSGTVWIDAAEFEVAQAQVQLSSEVDLLGGVIGCLRKLAYTITRTRIAEGVWLNTSSSGNFEGRKLLDSLRIKTQSRCINFHPLA